MRRTGAAALPRGVPADRTGGTPTTPIGTGHGEYSRRLRSGRMSGGFAGWIATTIFRHLSWLAEAERRHLLAWVLSSAEQAELVGFLDGQWANDAESAPIDRRADWPLPRSTTVGADLRWNTRRKRVADLMPTIRGSSAAAIGLPSSAPPARGDRIAISPSVLYNNCASGQSPHKRKGLRPQISIRDDLLRRFASRGICTVARLEGQRRTVMGNSPQERLTAQRELARDAPASLGPQIWVLLLFIGVMAVALLATPGTGSP